MLEWQELCSHAIWVTVGIFVVPYAGIQICRGFYYLDAFPRFNRICRGFYRAVKNLVSGIVSVYQDGPFEFVLYSTAVIVIVAVAINKAAAFI